MGAAHKAIGLVALLAIGATIAAIGVSWHGTRDVTFEPVDARRTIVRTRHGWVKGKIEDGARIFQGIPYARSPTGYRRFEAPSAPKWWQWFGVRDATQPGNHCSQPALHNETDPFGFKFPLTSDEDCLNLNVFTPVKGNKPKAVLVYIHGGGYSWGSGGMPIYSGYKWAAEDDFILVTLNYRTGVFGFLKTTTQSPLGGNQGIEDQQAALRWVQENIRGFGGDPDRVTISGNSAGAYSVLLHSLMSSSKGLFKNAIMQSANSNRLLTKARAEEVGSVFTNVSGCAAPTNTPWWCVAPLCDPVTYCLKYQLTVPDIWAAGVKLAQSPITVWLTSPNEWSIWDLGLILQPWAEYEDGLMLDGVMNLVVKGPLNPDSILMGTTKDEGKGYIHDLFPNYPPVVYPLVAGSLWGAAAPAVMAQYPVPANATVIDGPLTKAFGDFLFRCGTRWMAARIPQDKHKVYLYGYNHVNSFPSFSLPNACKDHVCHAEELEPLFGTLYLSKKNLTFTKDEQIMSRKMQTLWSTFVKTGVPSTSEFTVPPYNDEKRTSVEIFAPDVKLANDFLGPDCDFWDKLNAYNSLSTAVSKKEDCLFRELPWSE
eukprot:TRINITY_DN84728_c0_g1_i1.p1 TRINITY_DN84728_c0_g1~~TRINITY_DN84728_c0_g1_i1.p1  ORF type:complete len:596 (+),score=75.98 TRINITY_DN84728_c0_g1_i1:93-1880(+)